MKINHKKIEKLIGSVMIFIISFILYILLNVVLDLNMSYLECMGIILLSSIVIIVIDEVIKL